ncbi:MAG: hypothetical protein ABI553_02840 [Chloroflexota bacterium]
MAEEIAVGGGVGAGVASGVALTTGVDVGLDAVTVGETGKEDAMPGADDVPHADSSTAVVASVVKVRFHDLIWPICRCLLVT